MKIKNLKDCAEFIAGDGCILRELIHPDKTDIEVHYSLAHAKVPIGGKTIPHKLKSHEVYYIISGQGLMHIDEEIFDVGPDTAVCIQPNSTQYIENKGNSELVFLCIVDPPWRKEDEEVSED